MKISINGQEELFSEEHLSVAALLLAKDVESPDMVSVQLNGSIVARETYQETIVKDADILEFLYFMGGGADRC